MHKPQPGLKLASINLVRAFITLVIGLGCALLGLWIAAAQFGVSINSSLDFKEDFAFVLVACVVFVPILYISYGMGFLIVKPFLEPDDYRQLVKEELSSFGFGPLRHYLLGETKPVDRET